MSSIKPDPNLLKKYPNAITLQQLEEKARFLGTLAGLAVGFWKDLDELQSQWKLERRFEPAMPADQVKRYMHGWQRAVTAAKAWADAE